MDHCQVMLGKAAGAELRSMIEETTGQPCPCARGLRCPLRPAVSTPQDAPEQIAS